MPAIVNFRFGQWVAEQPPPIRWAGGKVYAVGLILSEMVSGIFLARDTEVGEALHFVHAGGINIHPDSKIGNRVGLMHGVTLGVGPDDRCPIIGDDVFIGANASVIGGVTIGNGARIAANSLVVNDVPPGALAIGVPAKVLPQLKNKLRAVDSEPPKKKRAPIQADDDSRPSTAANSGSK